MNPIISIIVPCYKVEEYLHDTIQSVLNQTYPNWELILVDDGSSDRTGEICDEYAAKDSRIKVIHKPNGGLVSARNAGYNAVTGDWMTYMDGDDWISTNMIEELTGYVEQMPDLDVLFWKPVQELGDKQIYGKFEWPCEEPTHLYQGEECRWLAQQSLIYKTGIASAWNKLMRCQFARRFGIKHDDRLRQGSEGVEFSLRAFYYAEKVLYINAYYYHYRYNPISISKAIDERNTKFLVDCFVVMQEDIQQFTNKDECQESLYENICYGIIAVAMSTYFHPDNKESLRKRINKFVGILDNPLLKKAIYKVSLKGMDRKRQITMWLIRLKMYFMLDVIGKLKQYYLRKGKFDY